MGSASRWDRQTRVRAGPHLRGNYNFEKDSLILNPVVAGGPSFRPEYKRSKPWSAPPVLIKRIQSTLGWSIVDGFIGSPWTHEGYNSEIGFDGVVLRKVP